MEEVIEVIKAGIEILKMGVEALWIMFYSLWLSPESPAGLKAVLWFPIIVAIVEFIIRTVKRSIK